MPGLVVLHRLDRRTIPFAVRLAFVGTLPSQRGLNFGDSRRCWHGLRSRARFALSNRTLNNRLLRCCGFSRRAGGGGLRRRKAQPNKAKRRQEYCGERNPRDYVCAHFCEFDRIQRTCGCSVRLGSNSRQKNRHHALAICVTQNFKKHVLSRFQRLD